MKGSLADPQAAEFAAWFVPANEEGEEEEEEEDEQEAQGLPNLGEDLLAGWSLVHGRAAAEPLDPVAPLVFQHIETTYHVDYKRRKPVICLHGCTQDGRSVMAWTDTFRPYFYARFADAAEASQIRMELEKMFLRTDKGALTKRKREFTASLGREEEEQQEEQQEDLSEFRFVLAMEAVQKRSMNGWHRGRPLETFYRLTMAYPSHVKTARDSLEYANPSVTSRPISTYEANIPFELRFMVDCKLSGCQWIRLPARAYQRSEAISSNAQIQVRLDHQRMEPVPLAEMGGIGPMRMLSFDIEAKRKKPGFCKGEEDPCVCICAALYIIGQGVVHKAVFLFAEEGADVGVVQDADNVFVYADEALMLLAFAQYVRATDPDAFTGWNISGFDWPYLVKRAEALAIYENFMSFTRRPDKTAWLRLQTFQSKAFGARKSNELLCEGRFNFDALIFMLRGQLTKYRSYKLNAISKELLGDSKVDVDYTQIPVLHEGSDEDRARLCYYCVKDALLPLRILENRMAIVNMVEQARATGVPLKWLLERGQGIKTHSCIMRYKEEWELMPSRSPKQNSIATAGGYVRKPVAGHYRYPLATLDYSSLYPSIMQAHNICFTTVESLSWARSNLQPGDYWIAPTDKGGRPVEYCFVKKHIRMGVLPRLLADLLAQRAHVKGLLKKCDKERDKVLMDVLDGRQLAIKVVNNSVYGFTKGFIWSDLRLMDGVTRWGRDMIQMSAAIVEHHYLQHSIVDRLACAKLGLDFEAAPQVGQPDLRPRKLYDARIIYGDSVTADTPLLVRTHDGDALYVSAERLFCTALVDGELLSIDANSAKQYVTCSSYARFRDVWSDAGWTPIERIIRHRTDKHIYRITTAAAWVDVTSDHSLLRPDGQVVRPRDVLPGQPLMHAALPDPCNCTTEPGDTLPDYDCGRYDGLNTPAYMPAWYRFRNRAQIERYLQGFHASLRNGASMTPTFAASLQWLKHAVGKVGCDDDTTILSVEDLGPPSEPEAGYVYDLQTHNHHFAAGVGKLVVHNTDSIMIDFGDAPLQDIAQYARDAAALCTASMEPPNSLAPESLKLRSLYFRPKMYCSLEILMPEITAQMRFEHAVAKAKVSYKGVQSKRRDNARIGSETQQRVLDYILRHDNVADAVEVVKDTIRQLLTNQVDMSMLVITQGLSKTDAQYEEGGTKQRHTELKKRIQARTHWTGEIVPETGDRVPYIMKAGFDKDKASDLSEDPLYAMIHAVPINVSYYLKKQIMAATLTVFTCIWEPDMLPLISTSMSEIKLHSLRAYQELFAPKLPHMLHAVHVKARNYGIAAHATVLPTCAQPGCNVRLNGSERSRVVCDSHAREVARCSLEADHVDAKVTNQAAWDRCRACAGSGFDEHHCSNTICDNFFQRRKTATEVADIEDVLARFDEPEKEAAAVGAAKRRVIDKVAEAGGEEAWRAQLLAKRKAGRGKGKK
jgi:DNA polymerase elongation subunit (family B)